MRNKKKQIMTKFSGQQIGNVGKKEMLIKTAACILN